MKRQVLFAALVWSLWVIPILAQASEPAVTGGSRNEFSYSEPLAPPMPMNGVQLPLSFSSEGLRSSTISGGIQLGSAFNDNVLLTPIHHFSNVSYLVVPTIEIGHTRERWSLNLAYTPALTVNQQLSEQNQNAHDLSLVMNFGLSPHVNLRLRGNFSKTNNLFSGLSKDNIGPGPMQQSNGSVFVPLSNSINNNSGVDLTYRFGANSLVSAGGTYYFINYSKVVNGSGTNYLIDSRSAGASTSYAHRFASRHWVGMTYGFQQLMFDPGNRTTIHRPQVFYSYVISSHASLSFWAGPEYSTSTGNSIIVAPSGGFLIYSAASKWSPGGGAQYEWKGTRTAIRAGYLRQISDGGGLAEAVTSQQVDLQVQRQLSARWALTTDLGYATNHPLEQRPLSTDFRSFRGNGGVEYRLTDKIGLNLYYGRQQQRYRYSVLPTSLASQNRVWLTLSYYFARPLGR